MYVVGIDENGLGPLLGPLVVTAAAFETPSYDRDSFFAAATRHLPADDSKKLFGKNQRGSFEALTLAWLKTFGIGAKTFPELMKAISAEYPLERHCGAEVPVYCKPGNTELPYMSTSIEGVNFANAILKLKGEGINPVAIKTISVCPGSLNLATGTEETNKFSLDFSLMMHLVKELSSALSPEMTVLCGKVGSTRQYGKWFGEIGMNAWWVEEETAAVSTYRVDKALKVSFIRDGDASHLPIAVASMVGKYMRELAMKDLNQLLGSQNERYASGYRDKVTKTFASETKKRREEIGLKDHCFYRNS